MIIKFYIWFVTTPFVSRPPQVGSRPIVWEALDLVNENNYKPPTSLLDLSLEKPETKFIKKLKNGNQVIQENLPPNLFSSMKTLPKETKHLFYLANEKRKRSGGKYIWTNNGGIYLWQNNDSKPITIRIEKYLEHFKTPVVNTGIFSGNSAFAKSVWNSSNEILMIVYQALRCNQRKCLTSPVMSSRKWPLNAFRNGVNMKRFKHSGLYIELQFN